MEIFKKMSDYNKDEDDNVKILLNLSECVAHSFKFFVYILFSTHLNCYFKINRGGNKLGASII